MFCFSLSQVFSTPNLINDGLKQNLNLGFSGFPFVSGGSGGQASVQQQQGQQATVSGGSGGQASNDFSDLKR